MTKFADKVLHLEQAAPHISFPLYWTDTKGRLAGANNAWLRLIGIDQIDEVIGKLPSEYLPDQAAFAMSDQIHLVNSTRRSHSKEEVWRDAETSRQRYFSMVRAPLLDDQGRLIGVVGSAIDMTTERELTVDAERRSELAEIKERESYHNLVQKIAHDIQSPLTALSVMVNVCDELDEAKRLILKNTRPLMPDVEVIRLPSHLEIASQK